MSRARRQADPGSFYESFSDLIFLTLIVFVVLVLALVLRLRLAQQAVAARATAGERQAAGQAAEQDRLRRERDGLAVRLAHAEERAAASAAEAERLRSVVSAPAPAAPPIQADRRPLYIGGFIQLEPPFGFALTVNSELDYAWERCAGSERLYGQSLTVSRTNPSAGTVDGGHLEAFLDMLAYADDPRQPVPLRLHVAGPFEPTADGFDYTGDPPAVRWVSRSIVLPKEPVRFAWSRAASRLTQSATRRQPDGFRLRRYGRIGIEELTVRPYQAPERALVLRYDRLDAAVIRRGARELPLTVLAALLRANTGRLVQLPPEVEATLARLTERQRSTVHGD